MKRFKIKIASNCGDIYCFGRIAFPIIAAQEIYSSIDPNLYYEFT